MKRKVIQIADSTQLVSLPMAWTKKNGVKKGDELDVKEDNHRVIISTGEDNRIEKVELDINDLEPMIIRSIMALYKRGIDEIHINFSKPELLDSVQRLIGKEAVGYEIIDQGKNHCIIKNISRVLDTSFDPLLRRTFLLLISMAEESYNHIVNKEFEHMKNIAFLEEANNRFTTSCRRSLNKFGATNYPKVGPIYYIVEDLENVADQYKYLCNYLYENRDNNPKIRKEIVTLYHEVNEMVRMFYEVFYKFDKEKIRVLGEMRRGMVETGHSLFRTNKTEFDNILLHHLIVIMQKTFCMVGPYLTLRL